MSIDLHPDVRLAHDLAVGAGERLLAVRAAAGDRDAAALRRDGDRTSQSWLADQLRQHAPNDAVLSEEADDDDRRLVAERVWIIDPLDGTREFAEGREDWAVHVALWQQGSLRIGAVALPALGRTFVSHPPPSIPDRAGRTVRIVVSRTRPPPEAEQLRQALHAQLIPMGSAGAKTMAVVQGEADVYVHAGGQYEWDSAAPSIVASAAGLHVSALDGRPIPFNQPDPWSPELLVCRKELTAVVLEALTG